MISCCKTDTKISLPEISLSALKKIHEDAGTKSEGENIEGMRSRDVSRG